MSKKYRDLNKEAKAAADRKWRNRDKESYSKKRKEWREKNKDLQRLQRAERYAKHKAEESLRAKEYRKLNYDHIIERTKIYCEKNAARIAEQSKQRRLKNHDHFLFMSRKHSHTRRSAKRKLPATLTEAQWNQIKETFGGKCAYCGKNGDLQQDHFVAVLKGGEYTHNNIIPACLSCNVSKRDKSFFDWYPKYKYYSKKREKKILEFLHYENNRQQLALPF
jgi:hypothetical protein